MGGGMGGKSRPQTAMGWLVSSDGEFCLRPLLCEAWTFVHLMRDRPTFKQGVLSISQLSPVEQSNWRICRPRKNLPCGRKFIVHLTANRGW
jgi:hypothetical protein